MMLSDRDIRSRLREGDSVVEPLDAPIDTVNRESVLCLDGFVPTKKEQVGISDDTVTHVEDRSSLGRLATHGEERGSKHKNHDGPTASRIGVDVKREEGESEEETQ